MILVCFLFFFIVLHCVVCAHLLFECATRDTKGVEISSRSKRGREVGYVAFDYYDSVVFFSSYSFSSAVLPFSQ